MDALETIIGILLYEPILDNKGVFIDRSHSLQGLDMYHNFMLGDPILSLSENYVI